VVRIACVGDSNTFGYGVRNPNHDSYPAQLGVLLGERCAVRNFGVNAAALQKLSDFPYWEQGAFRKSIDFAPDIVLIMLGTNDTKVNNWITVETFIADYRALVRFYQALPSQPKVYALTPPAAFASRGNAALNYQMDGAALDELTAAIRAMAAEDGVALIDIRIATDGRPELFPEDGIHIDEQGCGVVARAVCEALSLER
jgi:lysophospholipase L1-like esterase